jgi:NADH:ubiquinone oxidoreductase subunit 6 (subunit J)
MKKGAFYTGCLIFSLTVLIDVGIYTIGLKTLGIFSLIGTLLVFGASMIWLIYMEDNHHYFRKPILVIPIGIFAVALVESFKQTSIQYRSTTESLDEVGNLLLSRYQMILWIVSIIIFFMFIVASTLISRRSR